MNFVLTDYEELLCLCIRHNDYLEEERIRALFAQVDEEVFFSEAKINGVASIVADALIKVFSRNSVSECWLKEFERVADTTGSYMAALDIAADLLAAHDIRMVGLKNSGITRGLYSRYGASPMGDLDVLVLEEEFSKAHKVLSDNGFKLKFRSALETDTIESAIKSGGAEYSYTLPNGKNLWFELQFRPVAGRWITAEREPNTSELVAQSVSISGSAVRLLSPVDNLIQVALHTAKHSFVRAPGFRLHTDVDRIVSEQKIDWELFELKVSDLRVKVAVYISLSMAKCLLNTPIPSETLIRLKPSNMKVFLLNSWLTRVGIFRPDEPKWSKLGYVIFVCLLFDDLSSFMGALFPEKNELRKLYPSLSANIWMLGYVLRIGDLMLKRNRV
jgi:hypothetical protein